MSLSDQVHASLAGLSAPTFPGLAPETQDEPFLTYARKPHVVTFSLDGTRDLIPAEVDIRIWHTDKALLSALASEAIAALDSYTSSTVQKVFYFGMQDIFDPAWGLYGVEIRTTFVGIED